MINIILIIFGFAIGYYLGYTKDKVRFTNLLDYNVESWTFEGEDVIIKTMNGTKFRGKEHEWHEYPSGKEVDEQLSWNLFMFYNQIKKKDIK
jgi:hypothetical protein